jgi:hypothetical protein
MRMADLKPGWPVVTNDRHRVGTVREVGQHYLLTTMANFGRDAYVPASAIANVMNDIVYLNVAQRDVAGMGWDKPPRGDDAPETGPDADLHRHV